MNYLGDEDSRIGEARKRYIRDLQTELSQGTRVLEVGCATGSLLSVLRDKGCVVTGVDFSQKFVETAKTLYGLDIMCGDALNVALPKKHFDAIILFGTIGNLQDIPRYLDRFHALLRDGGTLVFNFVDANSPVVRYIYRSNSWMFTPSINCFMSSKSCRTVLDRAGFRIISMRQDVQCPSLQKLFNHARMSAIIPLLERLNLGKAALPFSLPVPSVKLVKAVSCSGGVG